MGGREALEAPGVLLTDSAEGSESRPMIAPAVTGVYGWKPPWLIGAKGGIPMGCGGCDAVDRGTGFMTPPAIYWPPGFGEVADETEDESYDLVDRFGDRGGYMLCNDAAISDSSLRAVQ